MGSDAVAEIRRRDIIAMVEDLASAGHAATARKVYSIASKIFNWALARGIIESSPCAAVKITTLAGAPAVRQRILSDAEVRALWKASDDLGYAAGPFIQMLFLTGQRLREVAEMSWSELDMERLIWTIPPERMKGGAAHEVPLPAAAFELLKSLPRWTGQFVFSASAGERPIGNFSHLKLRIDALLGDQVAAWRFHDVRRSMRTGLGALPIPSNICEMCIGHQQPSLHRIYDLHTYRAEKRRAFELWAARLAEIVGDGTGGNVIPMTSRA
jgi:integrase